MKNRNDNNVDDGRVHYSGTYVGDFIVDALNFMHYNKDFKHMEWELRDGWVTIKRGWFGTLKVTITYKE